MNHHPPHAFENNIRVISNYFENFTEIFASQGAPPVKTLAVKMDWKKKFIHMSTLLPKGFRTKY
jgi:hypothetical protein